MFCFRVSHNEYVVDVAPIFHKAGPVPYSLREKVDKELDKQVEAGILKKVERSEWVVIVPKPDGSVRICSDYKVSINKVVEDTPYPLPTADDIFSTLAGGQAFTKIDLSNAFNQLKVDESSSKYLTINTTKGLFQPTRLPYGIKTAPLMFQNVMDQVLHGIPGSAVISTTYSLRLTLKQNIYRGWRLYSNDLKVTESELSRPNAVS